MFIVHWLQDSYPLGINNQATTDIQNALQIHVRPSERSLVIHGDYNAEHHFRLVLTHWGRMTDICVSKLAIIASDNGLSPGRRQAIIWTSARILLIGPLGTNFSEILIEIITFSFKKMRLQVSSVKWRPCCLGLNVLKENNHGAVTRSI